MLTSAAKNKGRKLQQLVRDTVLKYLPELTENDVRSTSMGAPGEDILLSEKALQVFPFSVECKARKELAIEPWFKQTKDNCKPGLTPLLIVKANYHTPKVIMDLDDFMRLHESYTNR